MLASICWNLLLTGALQCSAPMPIDNAQIQFELGSSQYNRNIEFYEKYSEPSIVTDNDNRWSLVMEAYKRLVEENKGNKELSPK